MQLRATQHRPKRDSQRVKEVSDLKRENHQLKRRLTQLRRQVERLEEDGYEQPQPQLQLPQETEPHCPHCGATNLMLLTTPTRTIIMCRNCIWQRD